LAHKKFEEESRRTPDVQDSSARKLIEVAG
jgi:hypothetical protein